MSFAVETEKLVNELIQAEYKNACEKFGDKYHSLHEGYAVLLEEVEEANTEFKIVKSLKRILWAKLRNVDFQFYSEKEIIDKLIETIVNTMSELAQVGAVLQKINNTIVEVKKNEKQ